MKGGMGQVQHIYHNYWRKDAAMKQPLERFVNTKAGRDCFFNECERWVSLGVHPNIVQCYFVCDMKGIPTVMMEWMEKGSLFCP